MFGALVTVCVYDLQYTCAAMATHVPRNGLRMATHQDVSEIALSKEPTAESVSHVHEHPALPLLIGVLCEQLSL